MSKSIISCSPMEPKGLLHSSENMLFHYATIRNNPTYDLSWVNLISSTVSWLIYSSLSVVFLSDFIINMYSFHHPPPSSLLLCILLSYSPWFDHPNNALWRGHFMNSSERSYQHSLSTFSLLGPNILLSIQVSQSLHVTVRNKFSHLCIETEIVNFFCSYLCTN